jgi:hypothetical protein
MYITNEQQGLINEVNIKHADEYEAWAEENKVELMKWFDTNLSTYGIGEACQRFGYYLAKKFMEHKSKVNAED